MFLQGRAGAISKLLDRCKSEDTASRVSIDDIKFGILCTKPPNAATARLFYHCISWLAFSGKTSACNKIVSAGGVTAIAELLARFGDNAGVVGEACEAILQMYSHGTATFRDALVSTPNIRFTMFAASVLIRDWCLRRGEHGRKMESALDDLLSLSD